MYKMIEKSMVCGRINSTKDGEEKKDCKYPFF